MGPETGRSDGRIARRLWACAAVTRYDMEENEGTTQLWLLSTDGKTQKQLTRGKRDGEPVWSPDGKWIAFVSKRGEGKEADETGQIYLIAADGGEARRLTNIATGAGGLRWFPDGKPHRVFVLGLAGARYREGPGQAPEGGQGRQGQGDRAGPQPLSLWDHWFPRGRDRICTRSRSRPARPATCSPA